MKQCHYRCNTQLLEVWNGSAMCCIQVLSLASFPGRLPLRFLDRICDLWTARRSGRRPSISSTSSHRKVGSIMRYVDSVSVIMATCSCISVFRPASELAWTFVLKTGTGRSTAHIQSIDFLLNFAILKTAWVSLYITVLWTPLTLVVAIIVFSLQCKLTST